MATNSIDKSLADFRDGHGPVSCGLGQLLDMRFLRGNDRTPTARASSATLGRPSQREGSTKTSAPATAMGSMVLNPARVTRCPSPKSFDAPFDIAAIGADAVDRQPCVGRKAWHQLDQAVKAFLFGQSPGADQDKSCARRATAEWRQGATMLR